MAIEAAVGAISYLVLALLVGALMTVAFLLPGSDTATMRSPLMRIAVWLASSFLLAHILSLFVQGAKLSGGHFPSAEVLTRYVLGTQSGNVWLLRGAYAVFFLFVLLYFSRRDGRGRIPFFLLLPLLASRSLSGHAVAVRENALFVVASDAVHLLATASWAGSLPFLLYALCRGKATDKSIKRFSRLAMLSVTVLFLTGLYQALTHVSSFAALMETSYGNVLLLKLILFALMLALGAINFLYTRPMLLRAARENFPRHRSAVAFGRIGAESLLGMSILILSGLLTVLPPATHGGHVTHGLRRGQLSSPSPLEPAEGASVKIISPTPGQFFEGDEVPLQFALVKGKRGHHVHAYVDNELMGMFQSDKGTLTGITPGKHELELRVVAEDHQTELQAVDRVEFLVK